MGVEILVLVVIAVIFWSCFLYNKRKERPYILNRHTLEIHNKKCHCIEDMKNSNKRYITKKKRDKIISENPESVCGRCKSK